jgi:hypothetical protein
MNRMRMLGIALGLGSILGAATPALAHEHEGPARIEYRRDGFRDGWERRERRLRHRRFRREEWSRRGERDPYRRW